MQKPGRPLGVSIAIVASVMLFSVFPLLDGLLLLVFRWRLRDFRMEDSALGQPMLMGSNFTGLTDDVLLVHVVLALVFLVIAVLAWRGRPASIRYVMIAAVLLIMAYTAVSSLLPVLQPVDFQSGFDSGRDVLRGLILSRLGASALISLYVLWYLNRAPARAFYRGYYLPEAGGADEAAQRS
jgi:hypothetical protein